MNDRTEQKMKVLRRHKSSHAIFRSLAERVGDSLHTDHFSLVVHETPFEATDSSELLKEVLYDLAEYTERVRDDMEISDELQYINPFWTTEEFRSMEEYYG